MEKMYALYKLHEWLHFQLYFIKREKPQNGMLHVTIIVGIFFQFLKLYIFSHFKTKGKLLVCVYLLYLVIKEYFYSITKTVFLRLNILLKIENK